MASCIEHPNRPTGKYVRLTRDGVTKGAHRWAYIDAHGPISDDLVVRHKCDNPLCVNIDHLEVGTQADNMRDMVERGRSLVGERHPNQRISDEEWSALAKRYASGETADDLAREVGMHVKAFARRAKSLSGGVYCGAKLNSVEANEIRSASQGGVLGKHLAEIYETTPATISRVLSGKIFAGGV
jgi:hypothetical protein